MTDDETQILQAEVVAIQAVLISVFKRLSAKDSELASLFCDAFEEAEQKVTAVAMKVGAAVPLKSTVGALQVIEELRKAVVQDDSACRNGDEVG